MHIYVIPKVSIASDVNFCDFFKKAISINTKSDRTGIL